MEESDDSLQPLDIAGAAFFDAESESAMPKFGTFFKALGLKTFSFYDFIARPPEKKNCSPMRSTWIGNMHTRASRF
jgi:putative ATP-dependent endonuclease of the OLD family